MAEKDDWWTAPAESENGALIMVTGRRDVKKFMDNRRFRIRAEITWRYSPKPSGMPDEETAKMMEAVTDALREVFDRDPVAVMTGIYTGDGRRDWIFYTCSVNIFGKKINEALAPLPLLPLEIYTENDPEWAEYREMREMTEISASD